MLTALGWLLPNHYYPWIAFHIDAWIAWMFLIGTAGLVLASPAPIAWHWPAILVAILLPVPLLQYFGGLLAFTGQAWITISYLLALLLSLLAGAHAEKVYPLRAVEFLLAAIAIAAVCSVGLQLWQWLALEGADIWIVPLAEMRPFGNLAQPNQMATFHLWGVLCLAWAAWRQRVRPVIAAGAAAFLLMGVALTQSRTGVVAVFTLVAFTCYWHRLWPAPRRVVAAVAALALFYVACLLAIAPVSSALGLDKPYSALVRISGTDIRMDVYKMFLDAAWQEPWLGYGWTTLAPVQFAVAERHPAFGGIFQQSHNLFLDFVLWLGAPLGIAISAALTGWIMWAFVRVRNVGDAILFTFLAVVGLHAMLELPLHYAYMLLPAGFTMGVLNTRLGAAVFLMRINRRAMAALGLAAAALLAVITRDYLLIEADFLALRFERAYNMPPHPAPRVLLLDQLAEFNALGRASARRGMSAAELERMRKGADAFPSPSNLYLYTAALALNGRGDEAQLRMRKMAKTMSPAAYEEMGRVWRLQGEKNVEIARVPWID